jgi:hypothetical protein
LNSNSSVGFFIAMLGLFVASRLPDSPFSSLVRYVAVGYIVLDFTLHARAGYRRRRPHWTRDSWRRFLIACSVPTSALVVFVGILAALERRLPIAGTNGSTLRGLWVISLMLCMVVGVGGLVAAIGYLTQGDATQQFPWPRRRTGGPHSTT